MARQVAVARVAAEGTHLRVVEPEDNFHEDVVLDFLPVSEGNDLKKIYHAIPDSRFAKKEEVTTALLIDTTDTSLRFGITFFNKEVPSRYPEFRLESVESQKTFTKEHDRRRKVHTGVSVIEDIVERVLQTKNLNSKLHYILPMVTGLSMLHTFGENLFEWPRELLHELGRRVGGAFFLATDYDVKMLAAIYLEGFYQESKPEHWGKLQFDSTAFCTNLEKSMDFLKSQKDGESRSSMFHKMLTQVQKSHSLPKLLNSEIPNQVLGYYRNNSIDRISPYEMRALGGMNLLKTMKRFKIA